MLARAMQRILFIPCLLVCLASCPSTLRGTGAAPTEVANPGLAEEWGVGSWIWTDRTFDKQTCQFWKAFDIPSSSPVAKARLRITADNEFRVLLDGRVLGRGSDW